MKKYIVIPSILSIAGHFLFFSILNTEIRGNKPSKNTIVYIITKEQFLYISRKDKSEITLSPLWKRMSYKNDIWGEQINIIKDTDIQRIDIADSDEFLGESKSYNFQEIQPRKYFYGDTNQNLSWDAVLHMSDLYPEIQFDTGGRKIAENILDLGSNTKMLYYIQGPASNRQLLLTETSFINLEIYKIKAKFRFWVTKDGRVNQVIVEEGSAFSAALSKIVNLIKSWHFGPSRSRTAKDYDWGIVTIRIQK